MERKKEKNAIGPTTKKNKIIPQISYYFCSKETERKEKKNRKKV